MEKGLFDFKKAVKCALLSFVVTVLLGGILAVFVYFLQIEEDTAKIIIFAIMIASVIFGGFVLAKNIGGRGLLNGLLMATVYFATLLLLSFVLKGKISVKMQDITRFITLAASGMLGGILGVNT